MHLDVLLQQGTSQAVIDDIIALSEEYNIITPYTSMLVLESDADRERFKVKPRFRMRDGEKFFAEGRANVNFDLVQQQMRRAGAWRIGMRRAVLQQLANLGRDAGFFQASAAGASREIPRPPCRLCGIHVRRLGSRRIRRAEILRALRGHARQRAGVCPLLQPR